MKRTIAVVAVAAIASLGLVGTATSQTAPPPPPTRPTDPAVVQGQATRLYAAYFLRNPDIGGLKFWIGRLLGGQPLANVSQHFSLSPEFQDRYGSLDDGDFVDLVYENVLDRGPDIAGRAFWISQLETGRYDRGRLMIGFSESPEFVEQTETTPPRQTGFGDGTHTDVDGTFRNVTNGDDCTWTRLSDTAAEDDDVIATGSPTGEGRSIVTVEEDDAAFVTDGCGTWVPDIGPITVHPTEPFVSGTYRVGRDIAPGTWTSDTDGDDCTWWRLSDFTGEDDAVIDEGTGDGAQTVTIEADDEGFMASEGCGTWTMDEEEEPTTTTSTTSTTSTTTSTVPV